MRIKNIPSLVSSRARNLVTTDTQKETLDFVVNHPDPAVTASDVAENFNISQQAANDRLKGLVEEGELIRKEVGAAAVVYWESESE